MRQGENYFEDKKRLQITPIHLKLIKVQLIPKFFISLVEIIFVYAVVQGKKNRFC